MLSTLTGQLAPAHRGIGGQVFLHRSCVPLGEVDL